MLALLGSNVNRSNPNKAALQADTSDFRTLSQTLYGLLLTGGALLISATIQATTLGLSLYHALIILNLSWLTNITTVTSLFINNTIQSDPQPLLRWKIWKSTEYMAYIAHFCATGAFGLWVFSDVEKFGVKQECVSSTVYWIVGHGGIPVTNPGFRKFWLVMYSFGVIPVVNAVLFELLNTAVLWPIFFFIIVGILIMLERFMRCFCPSWIDRIPTDPDDPINFRSAKALIGSIYILNPLILNILLILTTEKTIASNRVGPEEAYWTFGQTLAMIVALPYLIGVCKQLIMVIRRRSQGTWTSVLPKGPEQATPAQENGPKNDHELVTLNPQGNTTEVQKDIP
jgi:hypothetical protein